jgi:hypothetical protein
MRITRNAWRIKKTEPRIDLTSEMLLLLGRPTEISNKDSVVYPADPVSRGVIEPSMNAYRSQLKTRAVVYGCNVF